MARVNVLTNNFTSGEMSPKLLGQTNLEAYGSALVEQRNFMTQPTGGLTRRPGSRYAGSVKFANLITRLMPFQFSSLQSYALELGDFYIRFWTQGAQLQANNLPYELISPFANTDVMGLQSAQSADIVYFSHSNYAPQMLSRFADTNWTIQNITFIDGPYLAVNTTTTTVQASNTSGTVTLTASQPIFAATDINRLVRVQANTQWGNATITGFTSTTQVTAVINSPLDGTNATVNWRLGAWSQTTGFPRALCFYGGRFWFAGTSTQPQTFWGSAIGDYYNHTPGTNASDAVSFTLDSDQVNAILWMSPLKVLILGTTGGEWSLQSNDVVNQAISIDTIRAQLETTYGVTSDRPVRHGNVLFFIQSAGTKVHEMAYTFDQDGYFAPERSIFSEHITGFGISQPVFQAQPYGIYWAVRTDGALIGMTYLREQQILAWHRHHLGGEAQVKSITCIRQGAKDELWLVVQRSIAGGVQQYVEVMDEPFISRPKYEAFFLDSGLTYDGRQTGTLNISPTSLANVVTLTASSPVFSSLSIGQMVQILDVDGTPSLGAYLIRNLATNTTVTAKIIKQAPATSYGANLWAIGVNTVGGLDHLNGASVKILSDGATNPMQVVQNGKVSFSHHSYLVQVGLPYLSRMQTPDYDVGSELGSSLGQNARIASMTVRFYQTAGGRYYLGNEESPHTIIDRALHTPLGESGSLVTGLKTLHGMGGFNQVKRVIIETDDPLPMTILSINARVQEYEA